MTDQAYGTKGERYFGYERQEMVRFVPASATRVLEVGCASGSFGRLLKSTRPVEVWGIEPFSDAARRATDILDNVVVADIEAAIGDLPRDYFECVVFNDVLEHLRDPWSVLREIQAAMSPGSVVVASIPNMRHYSVMKQLVLAKRWDYVDAGVLDRTHLRFFTCETMRDMFVSAKLELVTFEGISGGTFPWKLAVLNALLLNTLDDMRYQQFACVARVSR